MTKHFLVCILPILSTALFGQDTHAKTRGKDFGISIGYVHQKDNFLTIGGIIGRGAGNIHTGGWSYGLASEFNLRKDNSIIGVKAFYDINLLIIGARINAISYFKGSTTDFRLTPEIGLTLVGLCNIYYGYNIPIMETEINEISKNRLSITVNIFRRLKSNGG